MDCMNRDSLYAVFGQVIRYHHHRTQKMLDKVGVYPGQPPMLFALYHKDGQNQKELAKRLDIKPATATVMLSRIEKSGLVERKQDLNDQRVSRVYITDKGKEVCKECADIMRQINEKMFSNFTEEEKIIMRRLLMQMRDNLVNSDEENINFRYSDD